MGGGGIAGMGEGKFLVGGWGYEKRERVWRKHFASNNFGFALKSYEEFMKSTFGNVERFLPV